MIKHVWVHTARCLTHNGGACNCTPTLYVNPRDPAFARALTEQVRAYQDETFRLNATDIGNMITATLKKDGVLKL